MIKAIKINGGFASKLPALQEPIGFNKGLNIVFGPNGCGKSTLLKICAAYCGIVKGGWSQHPTPSEISNICRKKDEKRWDYPNDLEQLTPGKIDNYCSADVIWDGKPSFLMSAETDDVRGASLFFYDPADSPDGMTTFDEQMMQMFRHPSQGEMRLMKIKKASEMMKDPPVINKTPEKFEKYNSLWQACGDAFTDYVCSLPQDGPVTLLLDEPDRSLSIENQILLWKLFARISEDPEHKQFIIATHCFVPLLMKDLQATWIDLEEGCLERTKTALRSIYN